MGCCSIRVRIIFAALGIAAGVTAGVSFFARFHNINATAWAFISAAFATVVLWLHIRHKRGTLCAISRDSLQFLMLSGCIGQLAGVCSLCTYTTLGIVLPNQDFGHLYGENFWIACVWSFMTWKWGFQLFWFARMYRREYETHSLLRKGKSPSPPPEPSYVTDADA